MPRTVICSLRERWRVKDWRWWLGANLCQRLSVAQNAFLANLCNWYFAIELFGLHTEIHVK